MEAISPTVAIRILRQLLVVALVPAFVVQGGAVEGVSADEFVKPGRVLMLRHALAPGAGDPPGFRLGFTGDGTPSGGGSLFQLNGSGAPRLLGAIPSD